MLLYPCRPKSQTQTFREDVDAIRAEFVVKMNNRFGVGICIKFVSALFQIFPQFLKIINLAVKNNRFCAVVIKKSVAVHPQDQ